MTKTREELNAIKKEVETLNKKFTELTDEELDQVSGGFMPPEPDPGCDYVEPGDEPPTL